MKDTVALSANNTVHITVELVDAQTKEPFKEHIGPDGKVHVEAEPEAEYWIAATLHDDSKNTAVVVEYEVDGAELGYKSYLASDMGTRYKGSFNRTKNVGDTVTTLKFSKGISGPVGTDDKGSLALTDKDTPWIGSVTLLIYHCVINPHKTTCDEIVCQWKPSEVNNFLATKVDKLLRSEVGSTTAASSHYYDVPDNWDRGVLIKKIKINYCSAVGLIHAGILKQPTNFYEFASQKRPRTSEEECGGNSKVRRVTPTKITKKVEDGNGSIISSQTIEMFDLTDED